MTHPSSSSGVFFQGVGESQIAGNSQLLSVTGHHGRANFIPFSGDADNTMLNSVASSGPSIEASSLLTDANSGIPHPRRNGSFNSDAYMRLSASPLSFTSNNVSLSGSTFMDGSSVLQQGSNPETSIQAQMHQVGSSTASMSTSRMGQDQHPGGPRGSGSFSQETNVMSQTQLPKKSHLDIKQEETLQQQVLQQQMQRHDQLHLQNSNTQLQALIQQQRLRQQLEQQQLLQRVQLLRQQQLRQQLIQQGMQPASGVKPPYENGVCSRRLMQYLYHQRQRPAENTIAYWRKFVAEYHSPRAKKRWCLALYDNVGNHSLGVFPQAAMDAWQCDICGSKSGKGFEASFEVLPRLEEIKFASGVLDELLYLDLPREHRFPSGMMMLEYAKAVQESVFEQIRVVREGQLRIIFTPDLKILSWEFCARCHEELLPRRLVLPQAKQLLQVAQKCQSTVTDGGSEGVSQADLQANSVMVATASRQLARSLGLQSLNDLGFSKRYVRCLQIAEVVNSMKDLMDFCTEVKVGPVEGLKNFSRNASNFKLQLRKNQELEQGEGLGLPADHDTSNKLVALQNSHHHLAGHGGGALAGSAQAALALSDYQNLMMRQSASQNSLQESSNAFTRTSQIPTQPGVTTGTANALSSSRASSQQQQTPQPSQELQQQMLQQMLLQDVNKNEQQPIPGQKQCIKDEPSYGNIPSTSSASNGPGSTSAFPPSQSNNNSLNPISSDAFPAPGNIGFGMKASDFTQNLHLPDDFVADIAREFTDNGFFDTDLDDNMNFSWKV